MAAHLRPSVSIRQSAHNCFERDAVQWVTWMNAFTLAVSGYWMDIWHRGVGWYFFRFRSWFVGT